MDTETTTVAENNEDEGFTRPELTKFVLTVAATAVVIVGGRKVLRRVAKKILDSMPEPTVEVVETTETTPETINA